MVFGHTKRPSMQLLVGEFWFSSALETWNLPCNNIFEPNSPTSNGNFPQINSAWHWSHSMSQSNMTQNKPQTTTSVLVASVELGDKFGLHVMSCFLHGGWWNVGHIKQTRKFLRVDLGFCLSISIISFFLHPPRSWKNCFTWNCLSLHFFEVKVTVSASQTLNFGGLCVSLNLHTNNQGALPCLVVSTWNGCLKEICPQQIGQQKNMGHHWGP